MSRGMIERDRDIEEKRRDEMAEKLSVYKREAKSNNHQSTNQSSNCVKRGRFDHQSIMAIMTLGETSSSMQSIRKGIFCFNWGI